jgi:hypothetical protein
MVSEGQRRGMQCKKSSVKKAVYLRVLARTLWARGGDGVSSRSGVSMLLLIPMLH